MSAEPPPSFEKFSYLLRPSKQVERKLLVEALQRLRNGGFPLQDYIYVGLGSVYYADFILFHRYLYMDKMICAEATDRPRRMRFNKPYRFIRLKMGPVADLLPRLSRRQKHFVWLDYDSRLDEDVAQDVATAANVLAQDSILLVTVDAEPRHQVSGELGDYERVNTLIRYFDTTFGRYVSWPIRRRDFSERGFPRLLAETLRNLLNQETSRRPGFRFLPLFNFSYADGAQMLSFGGMVGTQETERRLVRAQIRNLAFITGKVEPVRISVPPLTPREKHWLDQNLSDSPAIGGIRFELGEDALENFRRYRRHYPSYYETLL